MLRLAERQGETAAAQPRAPDLGEPRPRAVRGVAQYPASAFAIN